VQQAMKQVLDQKNAPVFQLVRKEALVKLLSGEDAWPWYGQLMQTPQTIAYMLQLNYWMQAYGVQVE
jgi:asparagine synthase (glutamine-hydrolysing)